MAWKLLNPVGTFLLGLVLLGCGPAPPEAPQAPPATGEKEVKVPAAPEVTVLRLRPENLDEAFNLIASDERVAGFEIPMGAQVVAYGRARQISTTRARILRFYRSRAYLVAESGKDIVVKHSSLSIGRAKEGEVRRQDQKAKLYITTRPGPLFVLRFDSGKPKRLAQPQLLEVLAAEKEGRAPESRLVAPKSTDNVVPFAKGASLHYRRAKPKSLERFSVRSAKRRALSRRGTEGKSRSFSGQVYHWSKSGSGRNFLD